MEISTVYTAAPTDARTAQETACYALLEELAVHIVTDLLHIAVLLLSKHVTGPSNFKVLHSNLKATAKLGVTEECIQPLFCVFS